MAQKTVSDLAGNIDGGIDVSFGRRLPSTIEPAVAGRCGKRIGSD
jgi:hypothetical protein